MKEAAIAAIGVALMCASSSAQEPALDTVTIRPS